MGCKRPCDAPGPLPQPFAAFIDLSLDTCIQSTVPLCATRFSTSAHSKSYEARGPNSSGLPFLKRVAHFMPRSAHFLSDTTTDFRPRGSGLKIHPQLRHMSLSIAWGPSAFTGHSPVGCGILPAPNIMVMGTENQRGGSHGSRGSRSCYLPNMDGQSPGSLFAGRPRSSTLPSTGRPPHRRH